MTLFDESILELPLFEPRHRTLANELTRWVAENAALQNELASANPSQRGVRYTQILGRDGWLQHVAGAGAPQGGRPDLRSLCLIRQALAHFDDLCDFAFAIHGLACAPLLWWSDGGKLHEPAGALARGERIGSLALSEPHAGSNLAAAACAARRVEAGFVVDGQKTWVSNADIADFHCVLARTGEGPGPLGLSLLHVSTGTAGLRVSEPIALLAPRAFGSLRFEDCRLGSASLIGEAGMGYRYAMEILDFYRVTVAAAALGFCRRAADASIAWVRERRVFGAPLFDMQITKDKLAGMAVYLDAAALLTARAAWEFDVGKGALTGPASVAKLYATEEAQRVIDDALQLFGAAGLVEGATTEQLYRQIRSLRIYEGTSEVQKIILAGVMAKQVSRPRAATATGPATRPFTQSA
jgi:acyl-CoA dehydrogenase